LRVVSVKLDLQGAKPLPQGYPTDLVSIGDHIRKVRMDRQLSQPDLSEILGTSVDTLCNWEHNRNSPKARYLPAIINFLGYTPRELEPILPRLENPIFKYRTHHNITLKDLAKDLGVDRGTLRKFELGINANNNRVKVELSTFLKKIEAF